MASTVSGGILPEQPLMQTKVVIIGAGACGLQCAHDLITRHNFNPRDLLILEARDRVGGRIHTARETRMHPDSCQPIDFALDHGACWVHGTGVAWGAPLRGSRDAAASPSAVDDPAVTGATYINPILPLLAEATTTRDASVYSQLDPVFQGNPWVRPRAVVHRRREMALYVAGRRIDQEASMAPLVEISLRRHFELLEAVSEVGQALYRSGRGMDTLSRSVGEVIEEVESRSTGDGTSHSALPGADEEDTVQSLVPFYMHLLECWHGASVRDLQLGAFVTDDPVSGIDYDSEYVCVGDFYGPHCNVKQGMETILEPLLRDGVKERIRLEQEVSKVRYDGRHVVIETAAGLCIRAEVCVSTLPVECLKAAITESMFEPCLDANKQEAISLTKMGTYKKVFLTFDRVFWPAQEAFLGLVQGHAVTTPSPLGKFLLVNNLWARRGIPCLEAILFSQSGEWATGKSDQEIRTAVLAFMQTTMNIDDDLDKLCTDIHVTRWEEDRFSRGAYSNDCLGASIRHLEELRRPEYDGRLLLAGEGTIPEFQGSVHAALFSGRGSADHIAAMLAKRIDASEQNRSDHGIEVTVSTIQ